VRFLDLRHFAAAMLASTRASTKEIMSRGGRKSFAMVVRYEHASEERDAVLAQGSIQIRRGSNVVPIATSLPSAHDNAEVEGEVLDLPPLTSTYEEECSGGETRTLNLAGPLEQDEHQYPLE
jgi:hypothetical protein